MQTLTLKVGAAETSALWLAPAGAKAVYLLAHGAGAGMAHTSMTAIAEGLAERGVATLRYNFLYMERGSKRTGAPVLAHAAVRAAASAARALSDLPLFAGGRSFGARMTSQAQALDPLPHVRGLIFFAFPLHPAAKPGIERAAHLDGVKLPMLFLQGDRDALAEPSLLTPVLQRLGARATLTQLAHADHSFHAPAKSGRKDQDVLNEALDAAACWIGRLI